MKRKSNKFFKFLGIPNPTKFDFLLLAIITSVILIPLHAGIVKAEKWAHAEPVDFSLEDKKLISSKRSTPVTYCYFLEPKVKLEYKNLGKELDIVFKDFTNKTGIEFKRIHIHQLNQNIYQKSDDIFNDLEGDPEQKEFEKEDAFLDGICKESNLTISIWEKELPINRNSYANSWYAKGRINFFEINHLLTRKDNGNHLLLHTVAKHEYSHIFGYPSDHEPTPDTFMYKNPGLSKGLWSERVIRNIAINKDRNFPRPVKQVAKTQD